MSEGSKMYVVLSRSRAKVLQPFLFPVFPNVGNIPALVH